MNINKDVANFIVFLKPISMDIGSKTIKETILKLKKASNKTCHVL